MSAYEKTVERVLKTMKLERPEAFLERADALRSLLNNTGFDEFLKTVQEDLQGFEEKRDDPEADFKQILSYRAMAVYAKEILTRVSDIVSKAEGAAVAVQESREEAAAIAGDDSTF